MSNIEGEKPKSFKKYAVRKKLGFLTLDFLTLVGLESLI